MPHLDDSTSRDSRQPQLHPDDPFFASCPIGSTWETWDFLNIPQRRFQGEARRRDDKVRRLICVADLGELRSDWAIAADDPIRTHTDTGRPLGRYPLSSHLHTEIEIDGARVHIDWVTAIGFGPGRSMTEAHIFVNDVLAGHAWRGGCSLGFGGNRFPAVARITASKALVVDGGSTGAVLYEDASRRYLRADADVQRPHVWLWRVTDSGTRLKATGRVRRLGDRGPIPGVAKRPAP